MALFQGSAVGTWVVLAEGATACAVALRLDGGLELVASSSRVRFLPVVWVVVVVLVAAGMSTSLEDMVVQGDKEVLLAGWVKPNQEHH
jgi:hypothetical protein